MPIDTSPLFVMILISEASQSLIITSPLDARPFIRFAFMLPDVILPLEVFRSTLSVTTSPRLTSPLFADILVSFDDALSILISPLLVAIVSVSEFAPFTVTSPLDASISILPTKR